MSGCTTFIQKLQDLEIQSKKNEDLPNRVQRVYRLLQ